jgi:hypothetical protein
MCAREKNCTIFLVYISSKQCFGEGCPLSNSSVAIALGYGLDDRGSRDRFPTGAENFSLHHRVQNGSGAHPASYPVGIRGCFPGVKRPGREADHSPPSTAEVKNECRYTFTPQYVFMVWCSVKKESTGTTLPLPLSFTWGIIDIHDISVIGYHHTNRYLYYSFILRLVGIIFMNCWNIFHPTFVSPPSLHSNAAPFSQVINPCSYILTHMVTKHCVILLKSLHRCLTDRLAIYLCILRPPASNNRWYLQLSYISPDS